MWLAGMSSKSTGAVIVLGLVVLILTHTRTALVAMLAGILVGGLSLFLSRKRVRRASVVVVVVVGIGALSFAPLVTGWFARGQSSQALTQLTGRTNVWSAVLAQPRTEVNTLLGYGMSNDGFDGTSIDSSWLSTYQDQGLVGDVFDAIVLLSLLIVALISPRSWESCRPLLDRLLHGRILHRDRFGAAVHLSLGLSSRHVAPHAPIVLRLPNRRSQRSWLPRFPTEGESAGRGLLPFSA